ncbi:GNAT family N-acetyltransferase [Pontivivens insulae]|uniref:N-acetyltransferase domain-containing protein n=1 Tax=Pontivivens insulae TaxID=1639689 RepID=A0A2R8ACT4_9RHOB|nr:GNAT family N-acetyltransferase [Pontivivens insulae]RED13811.1 RimJ/RimL family protein N-acetyltransferase [Pontivivens insulae]SPF29885.1 hypothetical protein POI8812_02209 [Pontivivens insulae]
MIETQRLILDRHGSDDLEHIHATWCDPLVVENISLKPCTLSEARARLLRYAGQWALDGWGFFAVRDRNSGTYLGEVGFLNGYRDIEPRMDNGAEMGWVMAPAGRGNGIAYEAVSAALGWADHNIPREMFSAMILADNEPSQKLARSVGFTFSHVATAQGVTIDILTRPRRAD